MGNNNIEIGHIYPGEKNTGAPYDGNAIQKAVKNMLRKHNLTQNKKNSIVRENFNFSPIDKAIPSPTSKDKHGKGRGE